MKIAEDLSLVINKLTSGANYRSKFWIFKRFRTFSFIIIQSSLYKFNCLTFKKLHFGLLNHKCAREDFIKAVSTLKEMLQLQMYTNGHR